jgi:sec-independent protein translocase protein TatB
MELMIIFILALLVVGPKKLPELSRQLGRGIREFRKVSDQVRGEIDGALNMDADDDDDTAVPTAPVASANGSGPGATTQVDVPDATGEATEASEAPPGDEAPTGRAD